MKKIVIALLTAVMALSAGASTLYVNGTKITGSTSFETGGGTVTYNATTKVLTVEGVNFSRSGSNNNGIDNQDVNGLVVNFKGNNSITINNADVLNLQSKTTVTFSSGETTLKCTANDQNAIKARGADVIVRSDASATLKLICTGGAAIEGKNGTENLTLSLANCEITAGRQAFYNFAKLSLSTSPGIQTNHGLTSSMSITIKAHTSDYYLHADKIATWNCSSNVTIKRPEYGLSPSELTQKRLTLYDVLITDEHTDDNSTEVGQFVYSYVLYENEGCAYMQGPSVKYKYTAPTTVTVPGFVTLDGITYPVYVENFALSGQILDKWATSVNTVTFEFGVKYIGRGALSYLSLLKTVKLPSSVKGIGDIVMVNSGSTSSTIDVYWATLDPSAVKMTSETFAGHNAQALNAYFATPPTYRKAQNTAIIKDVFNISTASYPAQCSDYTGSGNYYIVTSWNMQSGEMCEMALVGTYLANVSVTDNYGYVYGNGGSKQYFCTSIAPEAFIGKSNISKATLTSSKLKTIGASAFYNCSGLTTVSFGPSVQSIGYYAFSRCPLNGEVAIPKGVIGYEAFRYCTMTGLRLGDEVTDVNSYAFADCASLQTLSIGSGVTLLYDNAFSRCAALEDITSAIADPTTLSYGISIFDGVNKQTCVLNIPSGTLAIYKATYPWSEFFNIVDPGVYGDVNSDGAVNSGDVSAVYNVMLGITTDPGIVGRADVNSDDSVNAGDVSTVYEVMLRE